VDDPLAHGYLIVADDAGNDVCLALVIDELKLSLEDIEDILVALDLAGQPAFFDLNLVLVADEAHLACRLLDLDPIAISHDHQINLGGQYF
jgi:hypothetical protein